MSRVEVKVGARVYRVGDIEVDTAERCVRKDGASIHPRSRTFALLVYLIEHRDRVVPQQELEYPLAGHDRFGQLRHTMRERGAPGAGRNSGCRTA